MTKSSNTKAESTGPTTEYLSDRDKEMILYGIGMGRTYWDGYYGSDWDVLKMALEDYKE